MRTGWEPCEPPAQKRGHITGPLALPAALQAPIGHFSIKKVAKNGFLRYSILREKSEKPNEKLEGRIRQVMEVHMNVNRTLSRARHNTGPFFGAEQRFSLALMRSAYYAGVAGDANHRKASSG